jgi:hypothetical protein
MIDAFKHLETIQHDEKALRSYLRVLDKTNLADRDVVLRAVAQMFLDKCIKYDVASGVATDGEALPGDDKFSLDNLENIKNDHDKLVVFVREVKEIIKGSLREREKILLLLAESYLKPFEKDGSARESVRVEDIRFHVDAEELIHDFDLNQLISRVVHLFKWHTDETERAKYMAPYFAMYGAVKWNGKDQAFG